MRIRILPYKAGSASARALASRLGVRRLRVIHTTFRPRASDLVINWGAKEPPFEGEARYLNDPARVAVAQCKLATLATLSDAGVPCPEFTISPETASLWLSEGTSVVCRTLLRGSGGRGIALVRPGDPLPEAPLYTKYIKKADEYRIHVCRTPSRFDAWWVFDQQQKRRRSDYEGEVCQQIRNFDRGWVFCRESIAVPPQVQDVALEAVQALGLDFGAVDVGWNRHYERATVYEVNTAPGLEGTTLDKYARELEGLINARAV